MRLLTFVQRRPELLVLDEEGVLGLYDLTPSARDGDPAVAWRIAAFHDVEIDQMWGLEDGRRAVVRIQEPDETATFAYVDLDTGDVVHEVKGVLPYAGLDASTGAILEPARGNALLERDHRGHEQVVLRSLPDDAWVAFEAGGVLACSANARRMLGLRR